MPTNISHMTLSNSIDINGNYMIPETGYYVHEIAYIAGPNESMLKVVIERANTKIKFKRSKDEQADAVQYKLNNGETSILLAYNLKSGSNYTIKIEFD